MGHHVGEVGESTTAAPPPILRRILHLVEVSHFLNVETVQVIA